MGRRQLRKQADAQINAARALIAAGSDYQRAHDMLIAALQLEPERVEPYVDLIQLHALCRDAGVHLREAPRQHAIQRTLRQTLLGVAKQRGGTFDPPVDGGAPVKRSTARYVVPPPRRRRVSEANWALLPVPDVASGRG